MKNFGAYFFAILLVIGLLEILTVFTLAGIEICDFNKEVKLHKSHIYTPHTLVNTTGEPVVIINPKSTVDTLLVNLNPELTFCVSISHHSCPVCVGRYANPWLIRTIWPLFINN